MDKTNNLNGMFVIFKKAKDIKDFFKLQLVDEWYTNSCRVHWWRAFRLWYALRNTRDSREISDAAVTGNIIIWVLIKIT